MRSAQVEIRNSQVEIRNSQVEIRNAHVKIRNAQLSQHPKCTSQYGSESDIHLNLNVEYPGRYLSTLRTCSTVRSDVSVYVLAFKQIESQHKYVFDAQASARENLG